MTARLLCIGDIHIGRRPRRLPARLAPGAPAAPDLSSARAWELAVELAAAERVDAVLLAGDAIDNEDAYFEAYSVLRAGVARLAELGIPVLAVTGNHDARAFTRLADDGVGFRLVGRDGQWESVRIADAGGRDVAVLVGASFAEADPGSSPLGRMPAGWLEQQRAGALPVIGLLHADLDQPGSRYAPVMRAELESSAADAWLLGHIHVPAAVPEPGARFIGYLGSLCGMDASETGWHGAWLMTLSPGAPPAMERRELGPVRWEPLPVDVSGIGSPGEAAPQITAALRERGAQLDAELPRSVTAIGFGASMVGATPFTRELSDVAERLGVEAAELVDQAGGRQLFLHPSVRNRTTIRIDLDSLAETTDPVGILAARARSLESPEPAVDPALLELVRAELLRAAGTKAFLELRDAGGTDWIERLTSDEEVLGLLERATMDTLGSLLEQRGALSGGIQ